MGDQTPRSETSEETESSGRPFKTAAEILRERGGTLAVPPVEAYNIPPEPAPTDATILLAARIGGLRGSEVEVLKRTICKDLTTDELLLYLARCARKHLDPIDQVYVFVDKDENNVRIPGTPFSMGTRIDGLRDLSRRSGQFAGIEFSPIVPDPAKPGAIIGWRCTVWRKDVPKPFIEEALFSEYNKGRLWQTMPETMCRKVAESKALRAAFPSELAGWYEPAEMDQAGGK